MFGSEFPYTNIHELNLDWLIAQVEKLRKEMSNFVGGQSIKYADPIQWDMLKSYLANTIVLDDTYNAYMSIKDTPAGISLDNEEYWLHIGDFYAYVPEIVAEEGITKQVRVQKHFRFYVNGNTGSDDNDGLTSAKAFKTIDKAISMLSTYTEIRVNIMSAGTYTIHNADQFSSCAILITANVNGVIIELEPDSSGQVSFYNCHIHLTGVDAENPITLVNKPVNGVYHMVYGVNTTFTFDYVSMPYNRLQIGAGAGVLQDCSFKSVRGSAGSFIQISNGKVVNHDPSINAIIVQNSTLRIYGTFEVDDLSSAGTNNAIIDVVGGDFFYSGSTLSSMTTKYYWGVYANYSRVKMTTAKLAGFEAVGVDGNDVERDSNEIMTY